MQISVKQAKDFIVRCLMAGITPMLSGHPGIGKSGIIKQIAEHYGWHVIDVRLSTFDPCDLNGFPKVGDNIAEFIPMDTFPLAGRDKIPDGCKGWLIFLDEFNSAPKAVEAAAYKLILDRMVGNHQLHSNALVVAAGNLIDSGAIVNRMGTATQTRMAHLELTVTPKEWITWATASKVDHRIISYIHNRPDNLFQFDPKHDDKTFACPRTWEFASRLIQGVPNENLVNGEHVDDLNYLIPLLAGVVGESVAFDFVISTSIYSNIPSYQKILVNPAGALVNEDPAALFAVSHLIAAFFEKKDVKPVLTYLERLPPEHQIITLQDILQKDPSVAKEPLINKMAIALGKDAFI